MKNNTVIIVLLLAVIVGGFIYYQQHTKTASVELPGGKSLSVTTHD